MEKALNKLLEKIREAKGNASVQYRMAADSTSRVIHSALVVYEVPNTGGEERKETTKGGGNG